MTPNPGYVLQPEDVIEVRVVDPRNGTPKSFRSLRQSLEGGTGLRFLADGTVWRLPARWLAEAGPFELTVQAEPSQPVLSISASDTTWAQIADRFGALRFTASELRLTLLPAIPTRPAPGRMVSLFRLFRPGVRADAQPYMAEQFELTVDGSGWLWIPPVTALSGDANEFEAEVQMRVAQQQLTTAHFGVQVWTPAEGAALTWGEIATCLSIGEPFEVGAGAPQADSVWSARCVPLRLTEPQRPPRTELEMVRYHITPWGGPGWTLVAGDGRRIRVDYRPGEDVVAGVRRAYRGLTGNSLLDPRVLWDHAVLTVFPDDGAGTPFYGWVRPGAASALESALLLPDDLVFVTRGHLPR